MTHDIRGAGGGKKAKSYTPVIEKNSLRSKARGRILDLIAHGPIAGLANGLRSIYLDDTPLQNADGSYNFDGVVIHTREGYPDQAHIPGFPAVENAIEVSTEVKFGNPVVRSVSNNDADSALVTVQVQGLFQQFDNGDVKGYKVPFVIEVQNNGGGWQVVVADTISGKTSSPYQRSYRVPLSGSGPFEIRVQRTTEESKNDKIHDSLYWAMLTEVIDNKLSYPDSALVGIEVDAELFGSSMPSRSYDMKLSIISVPSNYDPETRTYAGIWDGTFKQAWTDNPAWAYYDLATHPVIGAGNVNVDKWSLYRIAQYCDELVPDGYGGMEPRFTCNTIFSSQEEAINALDSLASVFRGMTYWGTDSVVPVADMPADPVKLVTPANITSDGFEYSGTSLRERHSAAVVMWNDPEDDYRQKPELVEDPDSVQMFGWRETQITAVGCTSRGQARRLGRWVLYSERMETQTLSYTASLDHADLRPGDFIRVSDPDRAGARLGGRVKASTTVAVTLDKKPDEVSGSSWYLSVILPNGSIERKQVANFVGDTANLVEPLSVAPMTGAVWILSGVSVEAAIYRVTSVAEEQEGTLYRISATEHDPNKYAVVEQGLTLPETPTSLIPKGPVAAPLGLSTLSHRYLAGGVEHQGLIVSWTASDDARVAGYVLEVKDPDDLVFRTVHSGAGMTADIRDAAPGEWQLRLMAFTASGSTSQWSTLTTTVAALLQPEPPTGVDVTTATFSVSLMPRSRYIGASYEFWRSDTALSNDQIESNAVKLGTAPNLVDSGLRAARTYFYYLRGVNMYGVSDWYPVQATTKEDFDDIIAAVDEDIRRPGGLFEAMLEHTDEAIDSLSGTYATKVYADSSVARAVSKATVNGKEAIFGISVDGTVAEIGAVADRFYVYNPEGGDYAPAFVVENGKATIPEAFINRLTFTKLRSEDGSLLVENGKLKAEFIQADRLVIGYDNVEGLGDLAGLDNLRFTDLVGEKPPVDATRNISRGVWTAGIPYVIGDTVLHDGRGWACVAANTAAEGNKPPISGTSNTWWSLYADKGAAGPGAISILIPNSSHTVPASADGVVSDYSGSGTTLQVYEGVELLQAVPVITAAGQFTIGYPMVNQPAGIEVGNVLYSVNTATVAEHSAMSASVDSLVITYPITVRRTDGETVQLSAVQTITKSKAGHAAVVYWLNKSATLVAKRDNGSLSPEAIVFGAMSKIGEEAPTQYYGRFELQITLDDENYVTVYTSPADEMSATYTLDNPLIKGVRCILYQAGGSGDVLDQETIPVVADAVSYDVKIESTQGDQFRVGQSTSTLLIARVFRNGVEVTDQIHESKFKWIRVSYFPQPYPNDDATWNALYQSGYKQIQVDVDSVYARATFHCHIVE